MAATATTFIKEYGPGLSAYGLSAYALTRQYFPSADPKITALTLGSLKFLQIGMHVLGHEQKRSHQEMKYTALAIETFSLVGWSTLFSQKLPTLFDGVAVRSIAHIFGAVVCSLTWTFDKTPQPAHTWKYHASEVGCMGLFSLAALQWGFKSPNSITTALMITLISTIRKIVTPCLQSYFDTSQVTDPAKRHSMAQHYHLLQDCRMLITPLAIHALGQILLKKTPPLSEVLAMQTMGGLAFRWIELIAQKYC